MTRAARGLLLLASLAPLASCGPAGTGGPAVSRPRVGGEEVDPPPGGFRAAAGQTLYVPAYSSIYTSDNSRNFDLSVTLSLRNADAGHAIFFTSARYYDHDGKLVRDYLKRPLRVGPLAAVELFVGERDTRGGVSACFLVDWIAEQPVAAPVVESVMIGTGNTQGISFTSPARVVADRAPAPPP